MPRREDFCADLMALVEWAEDRAIECANNPPLYEIFCEVSSYIEGTIAGYMPDANAEDPSPPGARADNQGE